MKLGPRALRRIGVPARFPQIAQRVLDRRPPIDPGVLIATAAPLVAGYGKPGQTLTVSSDATYTSTPSSITRQWVMGEPFADPATFTDVLSTAATLTLNDTTHVGKRIARREIPAGGTAITSLGVVCSKLKYGSYFGFGATAAATAYRALVGGASGRPQDFNHDGCASTTWSELASSGNTTAWNTWKTAFPNAELLWTLPLAVNETAPSSGTNWVFDDNIGDLVQGKPCKATASGAGDAHYTQVFDAALTVNFAQGVMLRPGHEANGGWYTWAAINVNRVVSTAAPSAVTIGNSIVINGSTVTFSTGTGAIADVVTDINAAAISGITAGQSSGRLWIRRAASGDAQAGSIVLANGTGTPLTALNIAAGTYYSNTYWYVQAFRHVVDLARARIAAWNTANPGNTRPSDYFKVCWCPNKNVLKAPPISYYPGDAWVDEISVDNYDDAYNANVRYDRAGRFLATTLGYGTTFVSGRDAYAGQWFLEFASAQPSSGQMTGRDASGIKKRMSWNEWGNGFKNDDYLAGGGDNHLYVEKSLQFMEANGFDGLSGNWNAYGADYRTRTILSSNVLNSIRNASHRSRFQSPNYAGETNATQNFTTEDQLAYGMWDEMPNSLKAFVKYFGTEAAQAALKTPQTIAQPTITCANISAARGTTAAFLIQPSNPINEIIEIIVQTQNGTATAGSDYTAVASTRHYIPPGKFPYKINVPIAAGSGSPENFKLLLSQPTTPASGPNAYVPNFTLGTTEATCTIYPGVSVADVTYAEDVGNAAITVSIAAALGQPFTVDYATRNGTATAGTDYTATNGTLSFSGSDTSKQFNVPVANDTAQELAETFFVDLSNISVGAISRATATVTISANDAPDYLDGAVAAYDASDASKWTSNGTTPAQWASSVAGGGNLAGAELAGTGSPANSPSRSTTGLGAISFTRGNGTSAETDLMLAAASAAVSQLFNGTDPDFALLLAFKSTSSAIDEIVLGASMVGATNNGRLHFQRRIGSNQSVFAMRGPGQTLISVASGFVIPINVLAVIGVLHKAGKTSVIGSVNGATPTVGVSEAAQACTGTFTGMQYEVGITKTNGASATYALGGAFNGEMYENVALNASGITESDMVTRVGELLTKWGS